jgi:long-subunit fatty acid transport protein
MQKRIFYGVIGILCSFASFAQNDIDAMRYSQITFGGTARFASMGGSMSALGGDFATLSFNPAGIAVYKKTELTITPSIFSQTTNSTFKDKSSSDRKLNFNLGNIGIVTTYKVRDTTTGWSTLNFGFGYNRTNNFHNRTDARGYNTSSSLLDVYVSNANGHTPDNFDGFSTGLAWTTYLINPDTAAPDSTHYNHVITNYGELQRKSTETKGSMGEIVLSFGGNYKEKLMIGATLGIVRARYDEEVTYQETDDKDTINGFKSFKYVQNLNTEGTGVNFKLGVIVKATDWLRLGAAVHTPTGIKFADNYSSYMESDLDGGINYTDSSKEGSFDYSIVTPFRVIGSAGFIINKIGLLNIEYEYLDYSSAQLYSHPNVFGDVNTTIQTKYTSTGNLRIGGEVRFDPLAFRVGYALYGSPFKTGDNKDATRSSYSAGIGYRVNNFMIDFAYVRTMYTEKNYFYDPAIVSSVKNNYNASSFMITVGARF